MAFIRLARRFASAFVLLPLSVLAAQPPADRLLDEQRSAARLRQLAPDALPSAPALAPALTTHPADITESGPALDHPAISIDSHGLLTARELEVVVSPFRTQALGQQRLALLLRQLDARLVAAGWVTSRARLIEFGGKKQRVHIELVPGRIERIESADASPATLACALPIATGDVVALEAIEQGVQQINRLRMYRANVKIRPGSAIGTSLLDIQLTSGKPWHVSFGIDNQGQTDTGAERVRLGARIENRLDLFEDVQLAYVRSERSDAFLASIALPQGFDTWSATASASRSTSRVLDYDYTGRALNIALGWNRVLSLSREGREAVDLTFTRSRNARKLDSLRFATDRVSVLRAGWTRVRQGPSYQYYLEPSLSVGLPVLGATDDPGALPRTHVHHQFTKLALDAGVVGRPMSSVELSGQLGAQRARVGLVGVEQISLGGLSSVRGFDEAAVSGDTGLMLRTEARFPNAFASKRYAPVPYAHLDHGVTWLAGGRRDTLSSFGAGIRGIADSLTWEAALSAPLRRSDDIPRHAWRLHFTLAYEF